MDTPENHPSGQPLDLVSTEGLGLVEVAQQCARHCREGMQQPDTTQDQIGRFLNAAMLLEQTSNEIQRLRQVWEDTRTQRDELLAHLAGKAPLPQWAAEWLKA